MQNELSQEEIDAMVRAARGSGHAETSQKAEPMVVHWDVRRAGQIESEQLRTITELHEGFARSLTHSETYLRVVFVVTLVSAEQHMLSRS